MAIAQWRKRRAFPNNPEMARGARTGWLTMQSVANQSPPEIPC